MDITAFTIGMLVGIIFGFLIMCGALILMILAEARVTRHKMQADEDLGDAPGIVDTRPDLSRIK